MIPVPPWGGVVFVKSRGHVATYAPASSDQNIRALAHSPSTARVYRLRPKKRQMSSSRVMLGAVNCTATPLSCPASEYDHAVCLNAYLSADYYVPYRSDSSVRHFNNLFHWDSSGLLGHVLGLAVLHATAWWVYEIWYRETRKTPIYHPGLLDLGCG
jgi:hypothetical protein